MKLPIQITIRDMDQSPTIISNIQKKAKKLDRYYGRIMSCRVVLHIPQKHQHQGKLYCVSIDLTVPNEEIVINKIKNQNAFVAIRDAFNAAQRKLQNFAHKQRGEIKNHEPMTHG